MPLLSDLQSMSQPFRRAAITRPPRHWFHGIPTQLFEIYRQALIDLQFAVFEVEVEAFLPPDMGRITSLLAELRAFKPDLAIGLPYGSYALICRMPPERDGWRPNLFVDVLEIPTICIWDHPPVEHADQILGPLPTRAADSRPGALGILRRALTNPWLVHWSRDSGQTRIMRQLGFARPGQVVQTVTPALPGFAPAAENTTAETGAAFIGNFYHDAMHFAEAEVEDLKMGAIARWIGRPTALWDEIAEAIAALPADRRQDLALDYDQTFFWRFAHQLIERAGQTAKRLHVLGAAGTPVTVYGDFQPDAPNVPANLHASPERFRYGPELAVAFRRHPLTIDVLSSGFVDGYSNKSINGFASGGFMLVDRKRDFVAAFGDLGKAVSYANGEELAAKVDRLLTNPRERQELGDAMRAEIRSNHTFSPVFAGVLRSAAEIARKKRRGVFASLLRSAADIVRKKSRHPDSSPALDLLAVLQTRLHWRGARIDRLPGSSLVTTSPDPWAYAAEMPIGELSATLHDPYVCLTLIVETGRAGICLIRTQTDELLFEQLVSASRHEVSLNIELQQKTPVTIIVRNTTEGPSRVRLLKAELLERI